MRIITPTGKIYSIAKAVPLAEKKEFFNDRVSVKREPATSLKAKPTAIRLVTLPENGMFAEQGVVIGNLKPEDVQDILNTLLVNGYYDFSGFNYQKVNTIDVKEIQLDNGASSPYYEECICEFGTLPQIPKFMERDYEEVSEMADDSTDFDFCED